LQSIPQVEEEEENKYLFVLIDNANQYFHPYVVIGKTWHRPNQNKRRQIDLYVTNVYDMFQSVMSSNPLFILFLLSKSNGLLKYSVQFIPVIRRLKT
jgi:hypothetical protein